MDILRRIKVWLRHPNPDTVSARQKTCVSPQSSSNSADAIPMADSVSAPDTLGKSVDGPDDALHPAHYVVQEPETDPTPFIFIDLNNAAHMKTVMIALHRTLAEEVLRILDQYGEVNISFSGADWDSSLNLRGPSALAVRDAIEAHLLEGIELPEIVRVGHFWYLDGSASGDA